MSILHAPSSIQTKKQLREHILDEHLRTKLYFHDPSLYAPRGYSPNEMRDGQTITVTNHPRRTWFATITRVNASTYRVK